MAMHVRLFSTLVPLSKSKQAKLDMEWAAGMTIADVVAAEGFSDRDVEGIAAVVNGNQVELEQALADGDEVEFIVNLQGGSLGAGCDACTR